MLSDARTSLKKKKNEKIQKQLRRAESERECLYIEAGSKGERAS